MRVPELLYNVSEADVAKYTTSPLRSGDFVGDSVAGVTITRSFGPVPSDKVLILRHFYAESDAGAAQITTNMLVSIADESGTSKVLLARSIPNVSTPAFLFNPACDLWLMPGEFLRFSYSYDAGVAVNSANSSYEGVIVPRGTIQQLTLPRA